MKRSKTQKITLAFIFSTGLLCGTVAHAKPSSAVRHTNQTVTGDRKIILGPVNGVNVTLIRGISVDGVSYYILNAIDQSDSIYEVNHGRLNIIFNNGMATDDTQREVVINGYRLALLNTNEIAELRGKFSFRDPMGWNISGRNIASATYASGGHHNVSFNSENIFTDGGGVYGGVALVRILSAPPQYRIPPTVSVNAPPPPVNVSRPPTGNGGDKLGRIYDVLGPAGWARCVAADTIVAALIARGDPVPPVIVKEHKSIGPVLSSLRGRMLARYPSHALDKLVQGNSIQIRNASDPFIAAFSVVDECTGSIARAMK